MSSGGGLNNGDKGENAMEVDESATASGGANAASKDDITMNNEDEAMEEEEEEEEVDDDEEDNGDEEEDGDAHGKRENRGFRSSLHNDSCQVVSYISTRLGLLYIQKVFTTV